MSILKKLRGINSYGERHKAATPQSIVIKCMPLVANPCVYFLKDNGEIVYIGSAMLVHSRIGEHMRRKKFVFDSVDYIEFPTLERALDAEGYYVSLHRPKFNARVPWSAWEPNQGVG